MVSTDVLVCPLCGGALKFYDRAERVLRTKNRKTRWVKIRRLKCEACGRLHRELKPMILPYKQYEVEVIAGVLEGYISPEVLGYEDYPCEATMKRWRNAPNLQGLLWRE